MIGTGSLVRFTGFKPLDHGKMYIVHAVSDGSAWVWTDKSGKWVKKRVPLGCLELVRE